MPRLLALLLLAGSLRGCVAYEYEHEFWVRVDGSGTVNITGRPELWTAMKGLPVPDDPPDDATRAAARELLERSGLRVRRVTITHRGGRPYLFVSADFPDVNRLGGTAGFPDLKIGLRRSGDRLVLEGTWSRPLVAPAPPGLQADGLMAVRFHLPSKVYGHKNAFEGVERGNIVAWRQDVAAALAGGGLDFGAEMDRRSILLSTVTLFVASIAIALALLGAAIWWIRRKGRATATAAAG
jgi:8-oxo-dGTP pyrophosphatase MutT (NUDIX family)